MNLKKIVDKHKRKVPHPFAYMGVVEGKDNKTSVVIESDKDNPMGIEDVMILVATVIRTSWRITNDLRMNTKQPMVSLGDYINGLYNTTMKYTTDGDIDYS